MPRDLFSIRLNPDQRRRLAAAASRRSQTVSELVRVAVDAWLEADEGRARVPPAEAVARLAGSLAGGDPGRSTSSGSRRAPGRARARGAAAASKRKK